MRYWESNKPKRRAKRAPAKSATKHSIASGGSLKQYPFLRSFYQHQAVISVGVQRFLFFLVMATLLYVFVFGDAGVIRVLTLQKKKAQLETEVAVLRGGSAGLQQRIDRLQNDPFAMEKLGRERYGYVHPGDRVYKIIFPEQQQR